MVPVALLCMLAGGQAWARPALFWFNDPVGPDETVLITGAELDAVTAATVERIGDGAATPLRPTQVDILQANPQSLKFIIPKDFDPGVYRFTLSFAGGSIAARLNVPTVYWAQGDRGQVASTGGRIEIFGRNIVRRAERARLVLQREDATASSVAAELTSGSLWRGTFRIPDDAAPGRYRLRLSNGDGGDEAWADAGRIDLLTPPPRADKSFDVRAYGAIGDGSFNNTRAVRSALDAAAAAGGGTVFFPRGRYLLSDGIVIPPGVRLKGERTDLVNLVWPDLPAPPAALISGRSDFAIEDLTIYASNHRVVIAGGFTDQDAPAADAADIAIRRVRIRASAFRGLMDPDATARRMSELRQHYPVSFTSETIRLSGNRIDVADCDIVGSGSSLHLVQASDAVIVRNMLGNGRYGWYSIMGSRRIIFDGNVVTAVDLQGSGGGVNTISNRVSASENVFIGGNTFKGLYGVDREAVTTDGPGGYYFGRAESTAADRLALRDTWNGRPVSPDWAGAMVMVVGGAGTGQHARVRAAEGGVPPRAILLERPLQVPLDAASMITIVQAQQHYLIVGNTFEDTGPAAQTFGSALDHVIADNRAARSSGFYAIGLSYLHVQPSWQVQILNNRITEGNVYRAGPQREAMSTEAAVGVHAYQTEQGPNQPPLARAIIIRANRLEQDAHVELRGFSRASPGIRDAVVEDNIMGASRIGLSADHGVAWWLERRNVVQQRLTR